MPGTAMLLPIVRGLIGACLTLALASALAQSGQEAREDCLYASVDGGVPLTPCDDVDPLELGKDPQIAKAIVELGIDATRVRFVGCASENFRVRQDKNPDGRLTYVIYYPSGVHNVFLAPTVHELAHVMQMDAAGGAVALHKRFKKDDSKRIELGADFMTGVLFQNVFPDAQMKEFEQNRNLFGQYVELTLTPHGTPEERSTAFARGINATFEPGDRDPKRIHEIFQNRIYGEVVYFSHSS